jgi:hypothetical protein
LSSVFGGLGLCRVAAPVHGSGWRKADVLLCALHRPSYFRGVAMTIAQLYAGTAEAGRPLVEVAWTVHHLLVLSSHQHRIVLSWSGSGPSPHEEHLARRSSGP